MRTGYFSYITRNKASRGYTKKEDMIMKNYINEVILIVCATVILNFTSCSNAMHANKISFSSDSQSGGDAAHLLSEGFNRTDFQDNYGVTSNRIEYDERYVWIKAFLSGDVETCEEIACVDSGMYDELLTIRFGKYEFVESEIENIYNPGKMISYIDFTFEVLESGCEVFPAGVYKYRLWQGIAALGIWKNTEVKNFGEDVEYLCKLINFLSSYCYEFNAPSSMTLYQKNSFNHAVIDMIYFIETDGFKNYDKILTEDKIKDSAYKLFGIEDFNLPEHEVYSVDGGWRHSGHGGFMAFNEIDRIDSYDGKYEIYVQFYANPMYIVKSHYIKYTVVETNTEYQYRFEKAEIVNESVYGPCFFVA